MSTVLDFPGYKKEDFNPEIHTGVDGITSTKLPPFAVPSRISVEANAAKDACRFVFGYLNDEPGERTLRPLPSDPTVLLRLAKHSKKILEVYFENASDRMVSEGLHFETDGLDQAIADVAAHRQYVFHQNAQLVRKIVAETPPSLKRKLRSALGKPELPGE